VPLTSCSGGARDVSREDLQRYVCRGQVRDRAPIKTLLDN
jgi:hypothetical protein